MDGSRADDLHLALKGPPSEAAAPQLPSDRVAGMQRGSRSRRQSRTRPSERGATTLLPTGTL